MTDLLDADFGLESEDDIFNPVAAADSDDDSLENNSTIGSRRPKTTGGSTKPNGKRRDEAWRQNGTGQHQDLEDEDVNGGDDAGDRTSNDFDDFDDDDDDVDDDENDEGDEDEEDAVTGRPRKRTRRDKHNQFINIEAGVDSEGEDPADEDTEETGDFIAERVSEDWMDQPGTAGTNDQCHRERSCKRKRKQRLDGEKWAQRSTSGNRRAAGAATSSVDAPDEPGLPGVNAHSIWGVKCTPGREREIIFAIVKRMEERMDTRSPMPILAAFERDQIAPGYVYIETRKQADIPVALDGIKNVYPLLNMELVYYDENPGPSQPIDRAGPTTLKESAEAESAGESQPTATSEKVDTLVMRKNRPTGMPCGNFGRLPFDVRDMIWCHLLRGPDVDQIYAYADGDVAGRGYYIADRLREEQSNGRSGGLIRGDVGIIKYHKVKSIIGIAFACRQLHEEVCKLWYGNVRFCFGNLDKMGLFFHDIGPVNCKRIRNVKLTLETTSPYARPSVADITVMLGGAADELKTLQDIVIDLLWTKKDQALWQDVGGVVRNMCTQGTLGTVDQVSLLWDAFNKTRGHWRGSRWARVSAKEANKKDDPPGGIWRVTDRVITNAFYDRWVQVTGSKDEFRFNTYKEAGMQ